MTSPKLLPAIALLLCLAPCAARADEIKVGITEYQGVEAAYKKYQQLFRELERQACEMRNVKREDCEARKSITFKFAIGTYGEVIDWYNKGLVDVAVLSALPMTDLLNSTSEAEHGRIADAFVGRVGPRPRGTSPLRCDDGERLRRLNDAGPPPAAGADQSFQYHVSAVVLKSSGVTSFDEIRERAKKKQVKFLFVRPFSVSGYVLPSNFLKERGVSWSEDDYEYTYQHHETLRRMLSPTSEEAREDAGRLLVGFAIEDTPYCAKDERQQYFTKLPAEGLEKNIPHEVVLANYNLLNTAPQRYAQVKRDLLALFTRAESIFRRASPGGKPSTDSLELEIKSRKSVEAESRPAGQKWLDDYDFIIKILGKADLPRSLRNSSTFDELIGSLATYTETTKEMPRLALVLSGGGAKCAYQAGAVMEIEDRMARLRADLCGRYQKACGIKPGLKDLDFDLVVGTSGGAINAFFAAMKVTAKKETQPDLEKTWTSFRQGEFFQPSRPFNVIFGLGFGLLQAVLISVAAWAFSGERANWTRLGMALVAVEAVEFVLAAYIDALDSTVALIVVIQVTLVFLAVFAVRGVRWAAPHSARWTRGRLRSQTDWWKMAGLIMVAVSAAEFLVAAMQWPSRWPGSLDANHALQHVWLLLSLIFRVASPWPILIGLSMLASGWRRVPSVNWEVLTKSLAVLTLLIAGVFVLHAFLRENSPSQPAGIEATFADSVPELLRKIRPDFPRPAGEGARARLEDLSEQITRQPSLIERDLVITASKLPGDVHADVNAGLRELTPGERAAQLLPDDLYFYFQRKGLPPPSGDKRFISFADNPRKLVDVVIGSGTIYPLFPARELRELRAGGNVIEPIRIIDGGFIHNSPIQAAIDWGATHIVLIEASPLQRPYNPKYFLQNVSVAFKYIFSQAQRMDTISRGRAEIFELRPTSECDKKKPGSFCGDAPDPDMDTFDFSPALLKHAFEAGKNDVKSPRPLFRRVPGPPLFRPFYTQQQGDAELARRP